MTKLSFALVFALLVALPFRSVLGQEDAWQSVLDQASAAGISQEAIDDAQKALGDGSAQKAAEEVLGDEGNGEQSLGDWIQQAKNGSPPPPAEYSPAEAPEDLPDDEVDDSPAEAPEDSDKEKSPAEAPENSPAEAPKEASTDAPVEAPELAPENAPTEAPSAAPEAQAPYAASPQA